MPREAENPERVVTKTTPIRKLLRNLGESMETPVNATVRASPGNYVAQ